MTQPSADVLAAIAEAGRGILQTKYSNFAPFAIMIYDHLMTFDIEVEYIWKQKFSVVSFLFLMTRYYFLAASVVLLFLFIEPLVKTSRMLWFVFIFLGAPLIAFPNCIIMLRIYAMYGRNVKLALALLAFIIAQAVSSLMVDFKYPVLPLDNFGSLGYPELDEVPTMRICLPVQSLKLNGGEKALSQIMQSIFDTVALAMILIKARRLHGGGLISLIARQGLVYYTLNVATYTTWTFMLFFAPINSKQTIAGLAGGFGCISVNRLTLHLRSYSSNKDNENALEESDRSCSEFAARCTRQRRSSWLGASTLEMHDDDLSTIGEESVFELRDVSEVSSKI